MGVFLATKQNPVQVHDPTLTQVVDKLTDKLMQLLVQLEAASDAAAIESLLAAVTTIASETTAMGRFEEAALARLMEIEEHRLQIMQGLWAYAKRKEERHHDKAESGSTLDAVDSTQPRLHDTKMSDPDAEEKHTDSSPAML